MQQIETARRSRQNLPNTVKF